MDDRFVEDLRTERGYVLRVCRNILTNEADAEDAAQIALLKAWQNRTRFRGESSVHTWVAAITRNVCHNYRRSNPRLRTDPIHQHEVEQNSAMANVADRKPFPGSYRHLQSLELGQLLEKMPPLLRDMLTMTA